ncbi:dihydrodipicolinate synthase family protein [Limimaricola cinnabarinus]|jgi:4-hydroxy-tetrahydrodipicolinate synthase|uniref:Dihydrodipicolinate synthase family protein n=1 Tax=Limimaricola cinnabarinus TaxID=1125964 RepID=A0A2G1MCE1_9RHOB|nr:dihydrodipicolinate synthase family protein [Limimaricola cinnabarinus]MAQ45491.1 dihydrodipicolinate synthase family protein [Actibacterium sp.]MAQ45516.1 dihydrodipicolinate synthase family protein [Actibacterium sp.]MAQ45541.1 dihydrodipicolinate synthase family protein [Actibacterium sp.]PHP26416.1 dihydrodipicolinate synthase family protein [Limimaricola cinnabarinus]
MSARSFEPRGVIPACLMPFNADMKIDEAAWTAHLRDIASVDGIAGIAINGHAAEVHALTIPEQERAVIQAREVLGPLGVPVVAGVYTESSLEAGRMAAQAQREGAEGLLVFPPAFMSLGGHMRPEMIEEHIRHITDNSDLPIVLFQFPVISNLSYPLATLIGLCEKFPTIRAVKDQIGDGNQHERQIRELHALDNPVNVLTTHSAWLLGSLAMGCDGLLSGAGSVIADLQVALFRAVEANDLATAKAINDRIYPTVRAFYDAPLLDMHNRMKEALVLLGKMSESHVRPPLMQPSPEEIAKIGRMMEAAGLTSDTVYRNAA